MRIPLTVGADIKINQRGLCIVEVNGSAAGTKGLRHILGNDVFGAREQALKKLQADTRDSLHILFFGETDLYKRDAAKYGIDMLGDPYNLENPLLFARMLNSKRWQKVVIPQPHCTPYIDPVLHDPEEFLDAVICPDVPSHEWVEAGMNPALADIASFPYAVVKKRENSQQGKNVRVIGINDRSSLYAAIGEHPDDSVVELFVPSKPIVSSETRGIHDGCMRLHVDCIVDTDPFSLQVIFKAAYWRLCPAPMHSDASLDQRFKANLHGHNPAFMEAADPADEAAAFEAVEGFLENAAKTNRIKKE